MLFVVEMWFRRCRCGFCCGDVVVVGAVEKVVVVGVVEKVVVVKAVVEKVVVVVEMRLVQNNDSKRIILPQISQPCYTNNSL